MGLPLPVRGVAAFFLIVRAQFSAPQSARHNTSCNLPVKEAPHEKSNETFSE